MRPSRRAVQPPGHRGRVWWKAPIYWVTLAAEKRGWERAIETAARAAEEHTDHVDFKVAAQAHMEPPYICNVAQTIRALAYPGPEEKPSGWLPCGCRAAHVNPSCTQHNTVRPAFTIEEDSE